jgi:hypothetical protein
MPKRPPIGRWSRNRVSLDDTSEVQFAGGMSKEQSFRPLRGRVTFFFGQKESNQRKGPYPTEQTEDRRMYGDFPTRQSLARSENDAHPCASPSGSAIGIGVRAGLKGESQSADAAGFHNTDPAN